MGVMALASVASHAAPQDDHLPAVPTRDSAARLLAPPLIATGNQSVDLLLQRDVMAKDAPAAVSAPVRGVPAAAAASGSMAMPSSALPDARAASLRDALLREGAEFASAHARQSAAEAAQMRADAQLEGGPLPPAASTLAAPPAAADGDSWLSGLRGIASWLREHRYTVGGVALALGVLAGLTSVWRAYRRMVQAREQARRRRRDSRPLAMRADTPAQARAATRTVLR